MKGIDEEGNDAETDILDIECRLEKLTQQINKEERSVEIETLTQEESDKCDMVRSVKICKTLSSHQFHSLSQIVI